MIIPYGSWQSPITAPMIAEKSSAFYEMHSDDTHVYWNELHAAEKGRLALIQLTETGEKELLPDANVKTRVHEYGGGAFTVGQDGTIFYSSDKDRSFYRLDPDGKQTLLSDDANVRFADGAITSDGIILVCEEHTPSGVLNTLVWIDSHGARKTIASGHDFYSSPRISPDGKSLVFLTYDFPDMPWDGTTLWLCSLRSEGVLSKPVKIAGSSDESICQVEWSPEGDLYFVSDRTGWWNIYRYKDGKAENLYQMDAEFGIPAWVFGRPTYAFITYNNETALVCAYVEKGIDHVGILFPEQKHLKPLHLPFTYVSNLVHARGKVYFFGASPTMPISIIALDPVTKEYSVVKASSKPPVTADWFSRPEQIEYPSLNGKKGYGFYYPPKNPTCEGPADEKPPLVVRVHGGPTARSAAYLSLEVQYWTSRGFAFLDVNYGGSTGYGREYFKRLERQWGVLDVEDTLSAVNALVERGIVDGKRLLIRGGSAGGYTVLCALQRGNLFAAGTSYFGVSDIELLCKDSHKFESRYTDRLVGVYPQEMELLHERSPIYHVDQISSPVLLLQGEEDKIVPPNQTFEIYEALKKKGVPVAMLLFPGEGHGFRQSENIQRSLEAELSFYAQILGLEIADKIESLKIEGK